MSRACRVLFLCTGNSARSILAEAILDREGAGRFRAYSAGSHPKGTVNPHALDLLRRLGYDTGFARSKSWDEFAGAAAPEMDIVITVCDQAAGEQCPYWPGRPATAHWGLPDPAAAGGGDDDKRRAFSEAHDTLRRRIVALVELPIDGHDKTALRERLREIGADAHRTRAE